MSQKYTSYDNDIVLPGFAEADLMAYHQGGGYQGGGYRVQLNLDDVTGRH